MANTANYAIPEMAENQANGYALFNAAIISLDDVTYRFTKRRHTIYLIEGVTPSAGAQTAQFIMPLGTAGASVTWNVSRIFFRVAVAGGAPQITVEKYTGTAAFAATTVGSVTLGSGASEGNQVSAFTTSSVLSGDKIRLNANTLATATGWTAMIEFQEA